MSGLDTEQLHRLLPFSEELGIRLIAAEPACVRLELDWQARLCTAGGVLHGGALMSLADTAGGVSAFLNLPEGAHGTTTVESKTNLLGAVREGTVSALATPLHTGRTLVVVETELRDGGGRLVAKTSQTQAVLGTRAEL
jgi:1,4-dihydroxy-2-naphthoyl-CoA hydrolase